MVWVERAELVRDFVVRVAFSTGEVLDVDLRDELHGEVFAPVREPGGFALLRVEPDAETISWPNGADLAPELVYDLAKRQQASRSTG
ncbi:MAG: DUF2442 domain-containing protein [Deltaproteobacteria bacterium]|nr:DUF2442 domain-containing protein [Deltaproteobacteria bacterium]